MTLGQILGSGALVLAGVGMMAQNAQQTVAPGSKLYEVRAPSNDPKAWNLWVRDLKNGNMLIYAAKDESGRECIAVFRANTPREGNEWAASYVHSHMGAQLRTLTLTEVGQGFEPPKQRIPGVPENPR